MSLSTDIIKKLNRKFEPSTNTQFRYRSNDVVVQADEEGNPIRAFIGKANSAKVLFTGTVTAGSLKKIKTVISSRTNGEEKAKLPDVLLPMKKATR